MAKRSFLASIIPCHILSCFCASYCLAANILYQGGGALNSSGTLVSKNGRFALGFVSIGSDESNASYLGIWYTDSSNFDSTHPFWLANREKPIADNSGVLAIDGSGNMKLTYSGGDLVDFYSNKSTTTNLTAVLEDSGNFVLKDASHQVLWQSVDSPTDYFVPGMKFGINYRTGQTWSLTSWLSETVPAPGAFTLEWDPKGQELVIKRRGVTLWTSGPIGSSEWLSYSLGNASTTLIISNMDEDYLMFTAEAFVDDKIKFSSMELLFNGDLYKRYYVDHISATVELHLDLCDGKRTENGCQRWGGPKCRSNGDQRFELSYGIFSDLGEWDKNSSIGIGDCKDICWKDCKCVGISNRTLYTNGTGCRFYYGDFSPENGGWSEFLYIIVRDSDSVNARKRNWIWIVVSVPAVVLIVAIMLWYLRRRKLRIREKFLNDLMTLDATNDTRELENDGNKGRNLEVYSAATIMVATNSFSAEKKLGQGGFGPVYKGKLPDGREIAIKRLSRCSGQGLVEFKNELVLIAKLQHMNLVRLLGCCIQGEERMLVYEFMPNKSLDSYIFDQSKRELLDWKKRLEIIEGIAQGLLYLHKYSRLRIIHRDLKASNILLDENLNPKISDFGMARIFKINESEANTNRIVGTYGYMSPEYAMEGIFSVKSDVFSFGVLVLEIVGGRKNRDLFHIDPPLNLVGYAWELWKEDNQLEIVDPTLRDSCSKDQVLRCIHVALLCVEDNATDRPTMSDVISMLTSEAPLPLPKQPAFSNARNIMGTELNSSRPGSSSINNISMTTMEAR